MSTSNIKPKDSRRAMRILEMCKTKEEAMAKLMEAFPNDANLTTRVWVAYNALPKTEATETKGKK